MKKIVIDSDEAMMAGLLSDLLQAASQRIAREGGLAGRPVGRCVARASDLALLRFTIDQAVKFSIVIESIEG